MKKMDRSRKNLKGASKRLESFHERFMSCFRVSDNKLALKLFGNKKALKKEVLRQKKFGKWIIHPCSSFRLYWNIGETVLLIINLIVLPVSITFFKDDLGSHWIVFNTISDTFFLIDLALNFRTGFFKRNSEEIVLDPLRIAKNYLKTFFIIDFVSSFPIDYTILMFSASTTGMSAGRAVRMIRLMKLLSLLRLLRLSRLMRYANQWSEFLTVAGKFMRIFNLVSIVLLICHWDGCLLWFVPMLQDFPADCWIKLDNLENAHWMDQYTMSLFRALSQMLSIGYGRNTPTNTVDVWLTMISMLIGSTCYALFVGHATTLIQSFDSSKRLYREKLKQVEEYMVYRKLPLHIRKRVNKYYEFKYQGKLFDERNILDEFNECLKQEVLSYNCRSLVASTSLFADADPNFVTEVISKLEFEVFQPSDIIVRQNSIGRKMYFIQEGAVDVVTECGAKIARLKDGAYFGEICLLRNEKRVANVVAVTFCNLFSLSSNHFWSVLNHYPDMKHRLEAVAKRRLHSLKDRIAWHKSRRNAADSHSDDDSDFCYPDADNGLGDNERFLLEADDVGNLEKCFSRKGSKNCDEKTSLLATTIDNNATSDDVSYDNSSDDELPVIDTVTSRDGCKMSETFVSKVVIETTNSKSLHQREPLLASSHGTTKSGARK